MNIYQQFTFDEFSFSEKSEDPKYRPNPNAFMEEVDALDYLVLASNGSFGGFPSKIIIAGEIDNDIKGDFYAITQQYDVPYDSGPLFTPTREQPKVVVIPKITSSEF